MYVDINYKYSMRATFRLFGSYSECKSEFDRGYWTCNVCKIANFRWSSKCDSHSGDYGHNNHHKMCEYSL